MLILKASALQMRMDRGVVYHCGVEDHFVEVLFVGMGKDGDEKQ